MVPAGDMEAARGYRHTGFDKRGSDINDARKLAGLNANQADGTLATNDAVRRYFGERFVVTPGAAQRLSRVRAGVSHCRLGPSDKKVSARSSGNGKLLSCN